MRFAVTSVPRSRCRACRTTGIIGAGLTVLLFILIKPVRAKGPVSATIAGPGLEQPLELVGQTDRELLVTFMEQSGLWHATGDLPRAISKPTGGLGPRYVVTWVNGGPAYRSRAERTIQQFIFLQAEQGVLIHTPAQKALENWGTSAVGWFAAPEGLKDSLATLGVPVDAIASMDVTTGAIDPDGRLTALRAMALVLVAGALMALVMIWQLETRRLTRSSSQ